MSESQELQVRLTNPSQRPLELHLSSGVVVIPARGNVTSSVDDAANPQVLALVAQGLLTVKTVGVLPSQAPIPEQRAPRRPRPRQTKGQSPKPARKASPSRKTGDKR